MCAVWICGVYGVVCCRGSICEMDESSEDAISLIRCGNAEVAMRATLIFRGTAVVGWINVW